MTNNAPSNEDVKVIKVLGMPIGVVVLLAAVVAGGSFTAYKKGLIPGVNQGPKTAQVQTGTSNVQAGGNVTTANPLPTPPTEVPTAPASFGKVQAPSAQIVMRGSTSLNELIVQMNQLGSNIDFGANGSSNGIADLLNGQADIAASSRALTAQEEGQGLVATPIGTDSVAFLVSTDNTLAPSGVHVEDLQQILLGNITDWSEIGGNPGPIDLVIRGKGGTLSTVEEGFALPNLQPTISTDSTTEVIRGLGTTGLGFATTIQACRQETVDMLNVVYNDVESSPTDPSYFGRRNLYFVTKGQPTASQQEVIDFASKVYADTFNPAKYCAS